MRANALRIDLVHRISRAGRQAELRGRVRVRDGAGAGGRGR